MRLNVQTKFQEKTHEGAQSARMTPVQALRRSVLSCFLWENEFYEDGQAIADRIVTLSDQVPADMLAALAVEARHTFNLRHAPLLLLTALVKRGGAGTADTIAATIGRVDEMAELLSIYWRDGRKPIPKQMKIGLAKAFGGFNEYQLAKYDRAGVVKLRDVLRLVHPKPVDEAQSALFKRVNEGTLAAPDTWEVALSAGANKRETFTRLLQEAKLGYLALLRNLRNMSGAGVDPDLIASAIVARKGADRVLPFRYVAAARACPQMEPALDQALLDAISEAVPLPGKTIVLVDVSGSMDVPLSGKSDMKRIDAAAALAAIVPGQVRVFTFSEHLVEVPPRRGMAGVDAVIRSQPHRSTYLGQAMTAINAIPHDRLIVVTDEQSADRVPDPVAGHAYMINIASAKNGVGYGTWTHIDGFSEGVLRFIREVENDD